MRWYELLTSQVLYIGAALVAFVLLKKLDPFLLGMANRLFKKINWVTGKDNFYFARWLIKIIQPIVLLFAASTVYAKSISDKKGVGPAIVIMGIFLILYAQYWPRILRRWEERRTQELLDGVKSSYLSHELTHERFFWAFCFILSFAYKFSFSEFCHKILLSSNVMVPPQPGPSAVFAKPDRRVAAGASPQTGAGPGHEWRRGDRNGIVTQTAASRPPFPYCVRSPSVTDTVILFFPR